MADASSWNSTIPSGNSEIRKGDDLLRSHWSILEATLEEEHFYVADNSGASAGEHRPGAMETMFRGAKSVKTAGTTIGDNLNTVVVPWEDEVYDSGGFFDADSDATEFVVPSGLDGIYAINASIAFTTEVDVSSDGSEVGFDIRSDGSRLANPALGEAVLPDGATLNVGVVDQLSVGSRIHVQIFQNSGEDKDLSTAFNNVWFSIHKIG